jgi:hypothetical protein
VAQLDPLRAAHLAKTAHGSGHAMRQRTKRANKTRALRVRRALNRHGPTGLAQPIEHYLRRRGNGALRRDLRARRGAGALGSARDVPCYSPPGSIAICAHNAFLFRLAPQLTFRCLSGRASILFRTAFSTLGLASLDNHAIGALAAARLRAQGRKRPRRDRMISLHAAFTAAVRVVHRVHGHAAHRWLDAVPT